MELAERLETLARVLDGQLSAMNTEAGSQGVSVFALRDANGGFLAAPVIVALANVTCAQITLGDADA